MERERYSTEKFVARVFGSPAVNEIVSNYRLQPEKLQNMMINCLREMGIFVIQPQHQAYINKFILDRLENDPQISQMVQQAKMREATRTRSRHSE